jgi:RNA recognition motif-containing protein
MSGRSRGFGFVEVESEEDMNRMIEQFDGKEFGGRKLIVNEAKPMSNDRPRRSNFGGGSRGGFGGGNGYGRRDSY